MCCRFVYMHIVCIYLLSVFALHTSGIVAQADADADTDAHIYGNYHIEKFAIKKHRCIDVYRFVIGNRNTKQKEYKSFCVNVLWPISHTVLARGCVCECQERAQQLRKRAQQLRERMQALRE